MRTTIITLLSIILWLLLVVGILLATGAGFLYMGAKAWESGWARGPSLEGPDGYTYCIMHETGIGQDPRTKLIRTKNIKDEDSYEDIVSVNAESSRLTVIKPIRIAKGGQTRIYITLDKEVFAVSYNNTVPFIYDTTSHQVYCYDKNDMSPFVLIENENNELYKPDVIRVILRVIEESSDWPTIDALKEGLNNPNEEVRKVSEWLMEIKDKGFTHDSKTIHEIVDLVIESMDTKDFYTKRYILDILNYLQSPYAAKAIPHLEKFSKREKYLKPDVSKTIAHINRICEESRNNQIPHNIERDNGKK